MLWAGVDLLTLQPAALRVAPAADLIPTILKTPLGTATSTPSLLGTLSLFGLQLVFCPLANIKVHPGPPPYTVLLYGIWNMVSQWEFFRCFSLIYAG